MDTDCEYCDTYLRDHELAGFFAIPVRSQSHFFEASEAVAVVREPSYVNNTKVAVVRVPHSVPHSQ
jgi:hypothetical protein